MACEFSDDGNTARIWRDTSCYDGICACLVGHVGSRRFCRGHLPKGSYALLGLFYLCLHCRIFWRFAQHAPMGGELVSFQPCTATSLGGRVYSYFVEFNCGSIDSSLAWTYVLQAAGYGLNVLSARKAQPNAVFRTRLRFAMLP